MERTRQRLGVIGAAVAIIAIAGVWYARPDWTLLERPAASAPQISVLTGPFSATYDFLTPMLGWALVVDYSTYRTRAWMFKTVDGGAYWERERIARALGDRTFLHFFDPLNGFAFTGFSYRTTDGGAHWLYIDVPGRRPYVTFASPTQGWAEVFDASGSRLYGTVDGGKHWTLQGDAPPGAGVLQPSFESYASTFRNNCQGWLGAAQSVSPTVFLTTDCAQSWQTVGLAGLGGRINPAAHYVTSVRLVEDGAVAVFIGQDRAPTLAVALSSDSGATWRKLLLPAPLTSASDISLLDSTSWWIFGNRTIYTTDDAGTSWRHVDASGLPCGWSFDVARAIDGTHAWMSLVSTSNSAVRALAVTADGGAHWQMVSVPLP